MPVHSFLLQISIRMPFLQLGIEVLKIVYSAFSKTLLGQSRQLNLCYVKPTSMFGSIMELKALCKSKRFRRRKSLIERTFVVGVEIVAHHNNFLRMRIHLVCKPFHLIGPIYLRSMFQSCGVAITGSGSVNKKILHVPLRTYSLSCIHAPSLLRCPLRASPSN